MLVVFLILADNDCLLLLSHPSFPKTYTCKTPWPPLHQRWRGGRGAGAWLLGRLAARYGATVVHVRHIFGFFPFLTLLTPGVEADEAVFKGVQILQITLGFVCLKRGQTSGRPQGSPKRH